jgi:quinol-cytochrome oxidoreductase complex cytochrome b subunit
MWVTRGVAVLCSIGSVALAVSGLRLLFAGDWLESHTVRYGPLALLLLAVIVAVAAVALAVIGAIRRPRDVLSWVVLAIVIVPVPLSILGAQALGI